jgi:ubiquinone/menaquinone biosynthesis C-methylase UbiE
MAGGKTLRTSERHSPDHVGSDEERSLDLRHRYAYELVKDFAEPQDRLLDVGSGEGYGSAIVSSFVAGYCGVDVSAQAVEEARRRYGSENVTFEHYEGDALPCADSTFDIVTSFQVIEHVADEDLYASEIRRVARPGARVLITTPNRKLRLRDGERPWNRYHLREYDAEGLRDVLSRAFRDVQILGVRGSEEMEQIERARLARAKRFAKLDRLGLRHVLPEGIDARVRRLLRRQKASMLISNSPFSLDGMRLSEADLDRSLDLFAVARL